MKCIVPLAGPDLQSEMFGLRPLYTVDGEAILSKALNSRKWAGDLEGEDYIFVVRNVPEIARLQAFLHEKWPGCLVVVLPRLTSGALMSAMCGVGLVHDDLPIIVDLADILFESARLWDAFDDAKIGMIVPVFESVDPAYSYLRLENGEVLEAREKQVISSNASAGVYLFKNRAIYIAAAAYCLSNPEISTCAGNYFICPMVNGVIHSGMSVIAPDATDIQAIGKLFHVF